MVFMKQQHYYIRIFIIGVLFLLVFSGIFFMVSHFSPSEKKIAPWIRPGLPSAAFPSSFSPINTTTNRANGPYNHVYVINVDDCQFEMFYELCTNISTLRANAASADFMYSFPPTTSSPAAASVTFGSRPFVHNIMTNRDPISWEYFSDDSFDNIYSIAKEYGVNTSFGYTPFEEKIALSTHAVDLPSTPDLDSPGSNNLSILNCGNAFERNLNKLLSDRSTLEAAETPNNPAKSIGVIHADVGKLAEIYGMNDPDGRELFRVWDNIFMNFLDQMNASNWLEDSLFVIYVDNGVTDFGEHGGSSPKSIKVPIIYYSPTGIKPGFQWRQHYQADIASNICFALGLPVLRQSIGQPTYGMFDESVFSSIEAMEIYKAAYAIAHANRSLNLYLANAKDTQLGKYFPEFDRLEQLYQTFLDLWDAGNYHEIVSKLEADQSTNPLGYPAESVTTETLLALEAGIQRVSNNIRLQRAVLIGVGLGLFIALIIILNKYYNRPDQKKKSLNSEISIPFDHILTFGLIILPYLILTGLWGIIGFPLYWGNIMGSLTLHLFFYIQFLAFIIGLIAVIYSTKWQVRKFFQSQGKPIPESFQFKKPKHPNSIKIQMIIGIILLIGFLIYTISQLIIIALGKGVPGSEMGLEEGIQKFGVSFLIFLGLFLMTFSVEKDLYQEIRKKFINVATGLLILGAIYVIMVLIYWNPWEVGRIFEMVRINEFFIWTLGTTAIPLFFTLIGVLILIMIAPRTNISRFLLQIFGYFIGISFIGIAIYYGLVLQM
jgi:hypothetical protein